MRGNRFAATLREQVGPWGGPTGPEGTCVQTAQLRDVGALLFVVGLFLTLFVMSVVGPSLR